MINFDDLIDDNNKSTLENKIILHRNNILNLKNKYNPEKIDKFLTEDICNFIIESTETYAQTNGWFLNRHNKYPTKDIPIKNIAKLDNIINNIVVQDIYSIISSKYNLNKYFFGLIDLFIIKYEFVSSDTNKSISTEQTELEKHKDGSFISFNILLNNDKDFEGGGTLFELDDTNMIIKSTKGDLIIHRGDISHAGLKIISGVRYVLVGFLNYLPFFNQNNYISNNIFNLNYNSWKISFNNYKEEIEHLILTKIKNTTTKLLNTDNDKMYMDLLENIVCEISNFHFERLKITNKENYYIEFWTKDENIDLITKSDVQSNMKFVVHNLHADKDEKLFKSIKQLKYPLLSTVTYLNKNLIPTIFTNLKQFNNSNIVKKKILFSFPDKFKHICFDGKYLHGVLNILNKQEKTRKTLMINLWEHKPTDVEYYNSENNHYPKLNNLIKMDEIKYNISNNKINNFQDSMNNILNGIDKNLLNIKNILNQNMNENEKFHADLFEFEK